MKRRPALARRLLVVLSLATLPAVGAAQTNSAPAETAASTPLTTSSITPTQPVRKRDRAISSDVAASLAAAMPKYSPPPKPIEEQPDLREIDKPKNGIIRLPDYVVREAKPPVFRERDINTQAGMAAIAMKKYGTEASRALNRFTIPLFGQNQEQRALAQYAEDERLKTIGELNDAAGMVSARDQAAGAYIKRDVQATTMRTDDYGWTKKR